MKKYILSLLAGMLLLFTCHMQAQIVINEVMVSNTMHYDEVNLNFCDWIELYNTSGSTVSLRNYSFSDDVNQPAKWRMTYSSASIRGNGYYMIYFDKADKNNNASFRLEPRGGTIYVFDAGGNQVANVTYPVMNNGNISYGRTTDGGSNWSLMAYPTPAKSNAGGKPADQQAEAPAFSETGGFFGGEKTLILASSTPGAKIYYTVNGDEPFDAATQLTDAGRMIDGKAIEYTGPLSFNEPAVIRAKTYADGYLPSTVVTHTFIREERDITLPIFSVSVNEKYRKDSRIGIWTNYNNRVMKRPSNLEFFPAKSAKADFNYQTDIEIFAASQRSNEHKQFNVIADKRYHDNNRFMYNFFNEKEGQLRKSINFRASGQDVSKTMMQDALLHVIIKDRMDIDRRAYQPVVVYINGQYNGLMNLRERTQKDYIESNYGFEPHEYDLLGKHNDYSSIRASQGNMNEWNRMINYLKSNSLATQSNYDYFVNEFIDEQEVLNYFLIQCYIGNRDQPNNNIKAWRPYTGNTKWRYILHDADLSMIYYGPSSSQVIGNTMTSSTGSMGYIFYSLGKNMEFRKKFAGQYIVHAYQTFAPFRTEQMVDSIAAMIRTEIPYTHEIHSEVRSLDRWESYVSEMRSFWGQRQKYAVAHIQSAFSELRNFKEMNLKVNYDSRAADIFLNNVELLRSYDGKYMQQLIYSLTAETKAGYRFMYWSINTDGDYSTVYNASFAREIPSGAANVVITAVFENLDGTKSDTQIENILADDIQAGENGDIETKQEKMLADEAGEIQVGIYPNPAENLIYISAPSKILKLTFYSQSGVLVKTMINPDSPVDISSFDKGAYILQIEMQEGKSIQKIVKM